MAGEGEGYSIQTGEVRTFGTVDYVLFSLVLVLSAFIGVFFAVKDRKKVTTDTFLVAGHSMGIFPVATSLSVTYLSALTLLGNPTEVYQYNTMYWWLVVGMVIAVAGSAHVFTPFFFRLKVTTLYEYLQMRFGTPVRLLSSVLVILQTLIYFSFVLYAPSLALSSVTKLSLWGTVLGIGFVVTFYTTLGGMKAVVWTDTFQAVIILAGLVAVLVRGSMVTGGFAHAWQVASERGRIKLDDFSVDPSTRHSVWSVVVGGGTFWLSLYGLNQAQVQRSLSCRSVRHAQLAQWVSYPAIFLISSLSIMIGVVMFAFYADCHPVKLISRNDQLLPLFVMDILADYEGIPGVFVACIFSGSISTVSSCLNALSAVAIKDLFQPYCCPTLSDFKTTLLTKLSVIVFGAVGMGLAYLAGNLGGTILQASLSVYGAINGPLVGIFLLGMFCPWANAIGAMTGCIVGLAVMLWIIIGAMVNKVPTAVLAPLVTSGCGWNNVTTPAPVIATAPGSPYSYHNISSIDMAAAAAADADSTQDVTGYYRIYGLSYLYYTITGAFVAVIVGLIVSFISGATKPSTLDPRLICPLFDILFPWLPECILKPLRFGIDHEGKYEKHEQWQAELEAALAFDIKVKEDSALPFPLLDGNQSASEVHALSIRADGGNMGTGGEKNVTAGPQTES